MLFRPEVGVEFWLDRFSLLWTENVDSQWDTGNWIILFDWFFWLMKSSFFVKTRSWYSSRFWLSRSSFTYFGYQGPFSTSMMASSKSGSTSRNSGLMWGLVFSIRFICFFTA